MPKCDFNKVEKFLWSVQNLSSYRKTNFPPSVIWPQNTENNVINEDNMY